MALATLAVQAGCVLALAGLTLGLASRPAVRQAALRLRATGLAKGLVYLSVAVTAVLLAIAAGGAPAPGAVSNLETTTLALLVAGLPLFSFVLSGHLELFAAADVLAELWREERPGTLVAALSVGRYLVRGHYDWASTASFLAGLLGLAVGLALSLSTLPEERLVGLVYSTVGLYGLAVTALTADHPYYRLDGGRVANEIDRLVASRSRD
jgi:hypothetical protein